MQSEKLILCGGARPKEVPPGALKLILDLWGTTGTRNVWLEIENLHASLWRDIPPRFQDLLEIATYVYSCDSSSRRGKVDVDSFGSFWRRHLHFHIPVREPDFWKSTEVSAALRETLEFLSDDYYDFTFYPATGAPPVQQLFKLDVGSVALSRPERVALFSGGLDSLAGAVEEGCGERRKLLLVNHRSTDKFCRRHDALTQMLIEKVSPVPLTQVRVSINKAATLGTEYTQRARSFLYASIGATVAGMLGLSELTFFENGVVSLNLPVCAQVVGSRATRTTHPRVVRGLGRLLTLLSNGQAFPVRTPFLWDTKADVIRRILTHGCGPLIALSRSCAETIHRSNELPHCGVCSQCIDRRVGVIAAEAEAFDPVAEYEHDVFTESLPKDSDKIMAASYVERANEIGKFRTVGQLVAHFPEVLRVLGHIEGSPSGVAERVLRLYQRHAEEVNKAIEIMMARHTPAIRARTLAGDSLLRIVMDPRSVSVLPAATLSDAPVEPSSPASSTSTNTMLEGIHQKLDQIRTDFREMRTVKERLEQMQGEKLFAFTSGIDPQSFHILCSILANGDVAKASRALNMPDSTMRSRIDEWETRGPAYKVLVDLVRWRKSMGRKSVVPLNEAITRGTSASADYPNLLADVLDELLEMEPDNWEEKAQALTTLLRPYVSG